MKNKHLSKHRLYKTWCNMKSRCNNINTFDYKYYGGRGIKVCKRWKKTFKSFLLDVGERPKGLTLDRIDNDGNYCKENCKWSTHKEQMNNKRSYIRGENHGNCKLSDKAADEIRFLNSTGFYKRRELLKIFNISATHLQRIINNKRRG